MGDDWAVASDNLNVKWDGDISPAEKYARAFGHVVRAKNEKSGTVVSVTAEMIK